jgi:hypothetical protein
VGTEAGSLVSPADPLQLVREWEARHGRRLVDPSSAAWDDLDSEAVVLARSRWRVALPAGTGYWRRRRYLSFDHHGTPERLIEVQLLTSASDALRARHADLLVASLLGGLYWIYALTPASCRRVQLRTFQDPARSAWDVVTPRRAGEQEPTWLLPPGRAEAATVLLAAA